jgi:hypothetical protein
MIDDPIAILNGASLPRWPAEGIHRLLGEHRVTAEMRYFLAMKRVFG